MKTKLIVLIFLTAFVTQRCNDTNEIGKQVLSLEDLQRVLSKSAAFEKVVSDNINYLQTLQQNFDKLPDVEKARIAAISNRIGSYEELASKTNFEERKLLLTLSGDRARPLANGYVDLVFELRKTYIIGTTDLTGLISESTISRMPGPVIRAKAQALCSTTCSNHAEATYWLYFNGSGDSDSAAMAANIAYAGCMVGCAQK